ncbi:condensation domain-containing protein [Streptomyces sp. NPDC000151]|uniref:condensation domain-containing protein n=1 Tax=Streptomyces sp. NPDC000151 TaxID=3154244 RepID=UPI003323BEC7
MAQLPSPPLTRRAATSAPLSCAQERLWFIDAAAPGSAAYNVPLLTRWHEPVDTAALARALTALVARHEILRTTYGLREGRPVQYIGDPAPVPVEVLAGPPGEDELADRARAPFDLSAGQPLRCTVWRGGPEGDAMLLVVHHIAVDGWSLGALYEDLAAAYEQAITGLAPRLPQLPVQYADFAEWDREVAAHPALAERVAARLAQLRTVSGDLALGSCPPRPSLPEGDRRGAQHTFHVAAELAADAEKLASDVRATPFVVLLAAFQVVVQRWTGRDEFLLATVAANRPHPAVEELVGFFVNTVPLHCAPQAEWTFERLCTEVRGEAFRALSHQRLPFEQLTAGAGADRTRAPGPLATVGFVLQNAPAPRLGDRPRWGPPRLLPTGTTKLDVTLTLEYAPEGLRGTVEYDTDRYSADTARQLAAHFTALLAAAVAAPGTALLALPLTEPSAGRPPRTVLAGPRRDLAAEYRERLAGTAPGAAAPHGGGDA